MKRIIHFVVSVAIGLFGCFSSLNAQIEEVTSQNPTVTVGAIPRVPISKSSNPSLNDKSVTVTLNPSPLPMGNCTVKITKTSGSGAATFDDGTTTKTITSTTTFKIRGTANSTVKDNMKLTATISSNSASASTTFSVRTWVTNWHKVYGIDVGGGDLQFRYEWDSESGNLNHLAGNRIGEVVAYVGRAQPVFIWTSPPYIPIATLNPTPTLVPIILGRTTDNQLHPIFIGQAPDTLQSIQVWKFQDMVLDPGPFISTQSLSLATYNIFTSIP